MSGAAVAAGAQAAGSVLSSAAGLISSERQMRFQERMSNTSHQREVRDLQTAGLNPILSLGGQGASAPQGAMFTPDNPLASLSSDLSTAKRVSSQVSTDALTRKLLEEQIATQSAVKLEQQAKANNAPARLAADLLLIDSQRKLNSANAVKLGYQENQQKLTSDAAKVAADAFGSAKNLIHGTVDTGKALVNRAKAEALGTVGKIRQRLNRFGSRFRRNPPKPDGGR